MEYLIDAMQRTCDDLRSVDNFSNATSGNGCFCSNVNVLHDGICVHPGECPSKIIKCDKMRYVDAAMHRGISRIFHK